MTKTDTTTRSSFLRNTNVLLLALTLVVTGCGGKKGNKRQPQAPQPVNVTVNVPSAPSSGATTPTSAGLSKAVTDSTVATKPSTTTSSTTKTVSTTNDPSGKIVVKVINNVTVKVTGYGAGIKEITTKLEDGDKDGTTTPVDDPDPTTPTTPEPVKDPVAVSPTTPEPVKEPVAVSPTTPDDEESSDEDGDDAAATTGTDKPAVTDTPVAADPPATATAPAASTKQLKIKANS
ncbi:MAG: hypothetical protein HY816_18225 [Candidatus Wallbacteria bacterium]|nr:hypothetical protein [Candidatus Wallbacteria bacterium]